PRRDLPVCSSVATAMNQIVVSTLRQASVPDELLGRVTAAYRLIVLGVVPLGAMLGGALAHWWGTSATFIGASIGLTLAALVFASRVTTRGLREAEQAGHAATTASSPEPDQSDAGPGEVADAEVVTQQT